MKRVAVMTAAYAAGLIVAGASVVVGRDHSPMLRLTGIHAAAAGVYLATMAWEGRLPALRWMLQARLLLVLAMALALWAGGGTPTDLHTAAPTIAAHGWTYLFFALDGACLLALVRVVGAGTHASAEGPHKVTMPSAFHNILLGIVPLGEALGVLLLGPQYATKVLGMDPPGDRVDAWWFGLSSLYLCVFWTVMVRSRARKTLVATLWGRVAVAIAFLAFGAAGVGGERSRLVWLAPPLLLSSIWTGLELRARALPWLRTRIGPASGGES